ncbi:MAG: YbaB/EbfC family nucleoid-associated protein [Nocardioides sp.]|nr:YbaB/EbfC family nucleoid-associated protein [Nocardioides sp.]
MSENPFDALGGGGFDMNALLQQAQQMQEQLQAAQEQLSESTVDGSVAGGAVTVTVSGIGDLVSVAIQPGTVDGGDAESLADLSDLVVAAYRDAKAKADELAGSVLGPMAGGLPGAPGATPGQLGF